MVVTSYTWITEDSLHHPPPFSSLVREFALSLRRLLLPLSLHPYHLPDHRNVISAAAASVACLQATSIIVGRLHTVIQESVKEPCFCVPFFKSEAINNYRTAQAACPGNPIHFESTQETILCAEHLPILNNSADSAKSFISYYSYR